MRRTWNLRIAAAGILALAIPAYCGSSEVDQHLRDKSLGKTFVLRGFYSGDRLQYDSAGAPKGDAVIGDWTDDGFVVVKEIRVSHGHLMIEAERRLVIHYDATEFQFAPEEKDDRRKLKIDADLGSASPGLDQAEMALSKVFLTDHEELASMVPDYWKPCVRTAGSGAAGGGGHRACRFSAEFQSIPGVAALPASAENVAEGCASQPLAGECPPAHGRGDIPRPIYEPACEFSESARKAKFQGVAMLKFVVDEQGLPKNIHITKPLGYGLNEQALKCVEKWRFKPAEKDGQPIAAEIAVEVSFHMY